MERTHAPTQWLAMAYNQFSERTKRMIKYILNKDIEQLSPQSPFHAGNNEEVMCNSELPVHNSTPQNDVVLNQVINDDKFLNDGYFGSSSSDDFVPGTDESDSSDCSTYYRKNKLLKHCALLKSTPTRIDASDKSSKSHSTAEYNDKVLVHPSSEESNQNPGPSFVFWDDKKISREGRKRKIRCANFERRSERSERTTSRNQGQAYITKSGKFKRRKELKDLPDCRLKCREKIPKTVLLKVFNEYWSLGCYDKRAQYISNCIIIGKKCTSKIEPKKTRKHTNKYLIYDVNDRYDICKKCFLVTFGESNRFVQTICEKKVIFGIIVPCEKGRAASYKKVNDERLDLAKQHILLFPAYESHYGRSKTNKKFLSSDLSLTKMYDLYKLTTTEPISKTVYSHIFKSLNLSFKQPSVDTCQKCDKLNKQLETASTNDKLYIKCQLEEHQAEAVYAYDQKESDKNFSKESPDTLTLTIDLQQCLPTPYLKTGLVFYKRQLWTYNLTIHDCASNNAFCYMWDESVSGRGANQIASCIFDFFKNQVPTKYPGIQKITLYSDTCAGQNKNSMMATMMLLAVHDLSYITSIEHKFLIPGHTRMEVDSDHSVIERAKKRTTMNIHHPRDWAQLIRTLGKPGKFTVIEMTESNFYDYTEFAKRYFTIKKSNDENEKFVWADVKVFRYEKDQFPSPRYKTDMRAGNFKNISFAKRGKIYTSKGLADQLIKCSGPSFISIEKKNDLLSILPYVDTRCHEFYQNLKTKADVRNIDPDLYSSEED